MSLIIKSNKVATANIGNIYNAPASDYVLLYDFGLGVYKHKDGGQIKHLGLSDAISFSRSSEASYLNNIGELKVARVNEPRIHTDSNTGATGLLIESGHTQLLIDTHSPRTQTFDIAHRSADLYVLSVKGSGSATISGVIQAAEANGNTTTAVEGRPAYVRTTMNGSVTVTTSGSLEAFSLHWVSGVTGTPAQVFTPDGVTKVTADTAGIPSSIINKVIGGLTAYTVVIRTVESYIPVNLNLTASYPVFSLRNDAYEKEGVFVSRRSGLTGAASIGALKGSSTSAVFQETLSTSTAIYNKNYVLSSSNGGSSMILAVNGDARIINSAMSINPNYINLGSKNVWQSYQGLGGIITSVIIYPYAVDLEKSRSFSTQ